MTILNKAADMVVLSVLWCLCSLPLLTLGASSAALYHTAVKVIRQNRGNIMDKDTKGRPRNGGC